MPLLNTSQPPPLSPGDSAQPCSAAACWIAVLASVSGLRDRPLHGRHLVLLAQSGAARSCAAATRSRSRAARTALARGPRRRRRSTRRRARRRPARSRAAARRRPARAPTASRTARRSRPRRRPSRAARSPCRASRTRASRGASRIGSRCAAKRLRSGCRRRRSYPFDVERAGGGERHLLDVGVRARPDPRGASSRGGPPSSPSPRSTAGRPRRSPRPRLRACDGGSPASNASAGRLESRRRSARRPRPGRR